MKHVYKVKLTGLNRHGEFTGVITLKSGYDMGVTGVWGLTDIDYKDNYFQVEIGGLQLVLSETKLSHFIDDTRFNLKNLESQIEDTIHSSSYLAEMLNSSIEHNNDLSEN